MKNWMYLVVTVLFINGCASKKNVYTGQEISKFKEIVKINKFEFEASSANPIGLGNVRGINNLLPPGSNQSNINLVGTTNYLRVKNDSIFFDLPYYGERQMGGAYNSSDAGLKFEGVPKKVSSNYDEEKIKYTINYDINTPNENLNLVLVLFPNKYATLNITSSHRTSINYSGEWGKLE